MKEMIKILIKLYYNILKDIVDHPESQVQLNFKNYENSECPNEINNLINDEESCNVHKTYTFMDTDKVTSTFLFKSVSKTLDVLIKEFMSNTNSNTPIGNSKYKGIGAKRLAIMEYLKSVIELVVYGIASNLGLEKSLKKLIIIIVDSNVLEAVINNFFKFEWNNLYQNLFYDIIKVILHKTAPFELIDNVINN